MPIQINTEKPIAKINDELTKQTKKKKKYSPTFFHKRLTGSPTAKQGFFNRNHYTLRHLNQSTETLDGQLNYHISDFSSYGNNTQMFISFYDQTISWFKQSGTFNSHYYTAKKRIPALIMPPVLYETPYRHSSFTRHEVTPHYDSPNYLVVPKDSHVLGINDTDSWTEILHGLRGKRVYVKPIIQDVWEVTAMRPNAGGTMQDSQKMIVNTHLLLKIEYTGSNDDTFLYSNHHYAEEKRDVLVCLPNIVEERRNHITKEVLRKITDNTGYQRLEDAMEIIWNLDIHDALVRQHKNIQLHLNDLITESAEYLLKADMKPNADEDTQEKNNAQTTNRMRQFIQLVDAYNSYMQDNISSETFSQVRQLINARGLAYNQERTLINGSLRLLLSEKLDQLKEMKEQQTFHPFFPASRRAVDSMNNNPNYSRKQKQIIQTNDPLVIGQAGAGVGKSHTIVGRLNYMRDNYINLNHVLVSSFTNVAADTIRHRFPDIRSETLAKVFAAFYKLLYPTQIMSNPQTFINSLKMINTASAYFQPSGRTPKQLQYIVEKLQEITESLYERNASTKTRDVQGHMRRLTNLVEDNVKAIELILNACRQTTFEIQPILLHYHLVHNPDKIVRPKDYEDIRYIITDESQDLSTFEYIILLEFVHYYKAQLLVVGDGSQTLYEFRNSNPEYMNSLEASGIFQTYKLDLNYRSNNDILTYANEFLDHINSNRYANINLSSNQLEEATAKSFQQQVRYTEIQIEKPSNVELIKGTISGLERGSVRNWILEKLRNNEQIAFLAHYKKQVKGIEHTLREMIRKEKMQIDIFTYLKEDKYTETTISDILTDDDMVSNMRGLSVNDPDFKDQFIAMADEAVSRRYPSDRDQEKMWRMNWFTEVLDEQTGRMEWLYTLEDVQAGIQTDSQALGWLKGELVHKETIRNSRHNDTRELSDDDVKTKQLFLSTIHGSKGLEFENTVVVVNEPLIRESTQENLRMYFVALSRAKQSEYIINLTTHPIPGGKSATSDRPLNYHKDNMYDRPIPTAWWTALDKLNAG